MRGKGKGNPALQILPMLAHETLYVGIDIGKLTHVAGFISATLLSRHQRFENCPALSFENSREGFRSLVDRISAYVPLTQVYAVLEVTGHYHRPLLQYLQELDIPVYVLHVQERPKGMVKTDKRDALGLANLLFNQLEKGIQVGDPLQAVRRLAPPTEAAAQIRGMVYHRYELIAESTQRKNKLTAICDEVFPEFTVILKNPNGSTALSIRKRFPTPAALAAASFTTLQEVRGKARMLSDAKLGELQRLAAQSIGTKDPARLRGLTFEQEQLIEELDLIHKHLEQLEGQMTQIVLASREGKILLSIPGIGPIQAAVIIAMIGTIANFERPTQLKSYFGWAPTLKQSGKTLDRAKLSPRGVRVMKQTMYLVVWQAIRLKECEWAKIYQRLVPIKCSYDERTRRYVGRGKIIGRIAGQIISVIFTLLKKDQETLSKLAPGTLPPEPVLYDPHLHRHHRAGQYQSTSSEQRPRKLIQFPAH
ncbi:MAG TPA: IS110 family transposase [Ktedonobacteraceae bacterium]|nr:IS110 family transposase [Ktedonobacteraceae bacterium]